MEDRERARERGDPMASLCTVATVDAQQQPQLRTLVLRDVDGSLAIFVNATSPKWPDLQPTCALMTYWPSVQIQYRLQVTTTQLPSSTVAESWLLRPDPPKRMDWLYQSHSAQSSRIESRETLLARLDALDLPEPLVAPPSAMGLALVPMQIERLDLTQSNGVHDRRRYTRGGVGWTEDILVP